MAKFVFNAGVFFGSPLQPAATTTTVTVINAETGSNAPLWLDRAGTSTKSNPFSILSAGNFSFYTNPGRYNITATNGGDTRTWNDVILGDAGGSTGTGIITGGGLTHLGSGVVRIASGIGQIVDDSVPTSPEVINVSWSQTDIDLLSSVGINYIYVDASGNVLSKTSEPTHDDYRTEIPLHRAAIGAGTLIGYTTIVQPALQLPAQIWDLFRALGIVKDGLSLGFPGANLTISIGAGEIYQPGANFYDDPNNPHEVTYPLKSPVTFRYVDRNGNTGPEVTSLSPALWDNNGVIETVSGASSRCTIIFLLQFPGSGGIVRAVYGQKVYNTIAEARTELQNGLYQPVLTDTYDNALTLGAFIVQSGATNLQDGTQIFVNANKFGLFGGAISQAGVDTTQFLGTRVIGVTKTVATAKGAGGITLVDGTVLNSGIIAAMADTGALIETSVNNTTSNEGGAKYLVKTKAAYRLEINNPTWEPNGYRDHGLLGASTYVAVLKGNRHSAYSFGLIDGPTQNNTLAFAALCQSVKNGEIIDFEGGEFRIFDGVTGIASSSATPGVTTAVPDSQLPMVEFKRSVTFKNGLVYAADQEGTGTKSYYPCTLSFKECAGITLKDFSAESKGQSYGDADASFPLNRDQRNEFLPRNSGCALLLTRCRSVTVFGGDYRLCGSVGVVYVSSCANVKFKGSFANAASLGYAAFAIDAWVGTTADTGFRIHDSNFVDCTTHVETLTTRDTLAPTGSTTYGSKGCVITEDSSVKVTVTGGYYADAYPNGSARDIGNAFGANASTVVVSNAYVENCASVGITGQSVDFPGTLIVSNVEARNIRKTMHQVQATSFGSQYFEYNNCDVEINDTGVWPGDGNRAREYSSIVANMKAATPVFGKITNSRIAGANAVFINDTLCYGSLMIDNCQITTSRWFCLSNGWGSSGRTYDSGIKVKDSVITDTNGLETGGYVQYRNNNGAGGGFTYINIDFGSSTLSTTSVRPAYEFNIGGTGLVTELIGFKKMTNAWSNSSYIPTGMHPVNFKTQNGTSGSNRRIILEYPNRVAFRPQYLVDNTTTVANTKLVLSSVAPASINAEGNVEQEFLIDNTTLTLWPNDTRLAGAYVEAYPPLL